MFNQRRKMNLEYIKELQVLEQAIIRLNTEVFLLKEDIDAQVSLMISWMKDHNLGGLFHAETS